MDINDFRGLMSAVILFAFLGLIAFTLMGGRNRFRDAADAPFADDDRDAGAGDPVDPDQRNRDRQDGRTAGNAQSEGPAR